MGNFRVSDKEESITRRGFLGVAGVTASGILLGSFENEATAQGIGAHQIGSNRDAVRNECWYSLDASYLNKPNEKHGPANGSSKWHYIATDTGALAYVLNTYQAAVSERIPYTGKLKESVDYWVKIFSDLNDKSNYAMNWASVKSGHGLQCVSFATAIIYRARGVRIAWSYKNPVNDGTATSAEQGDIIWKKDSDSSGHLAICVYNENNVVTVVDSNWQTKKNAEVINKHDFKYSDLNGWHKYSGKGRWYP